MKFTRRDFLASSAIAIGSARFAGIDRVFARQGSEAAFRHGVTSGDPLRDRVVLWTRVTPGTPGEVVDVGWMLARDARMTRVFASGSVRTTAERDDGDGRPLGGVPFPDRGPCDSTAAGKPWQVLGQQVMMSPQAPAGAPIANSDSWEGYRAARTRVFEGAAAAARPAPRGADRRRAQRPGL